MNPQDFVFMSIYKGSLKDGASERAAKDSAVDGLNKYKSGRFTKASGLIQEKIREAKMATKNGK